MSDKDDNFDIGFTPDTLFDRTEFGRRMRDEVGRSNNRPFIVERLEWQPSEALKRKCAAKREKAIAQRKEKEDNDRKNLPA